MKTLLFTTLALVISSFFLAPAVSEAKVLYEHSKVGTPYDLFTDLDGNRTGYLNRAPQYQGEPPFTFDGGGTAYEGTAEWFRVKRLSGLSCDTRFNININATDGTPIGDSRPRGGNTSGEYCDFPIFGPDRTNQSVGRISICVENDCDGIPPFILDGSPSNPGYVFNGAITIFEPGGWAFQICDIEGCSGGFGESSTTTATTTATTTPPTATSTGASSVLFLPGIQASRLYLGDGNQIYNRLWEPTNNTDISALGLSNTGTSFVDIRTNDVIDETSVDILGKNIYKSFMSFLDDLVSNQIINDWTPFAYDWRYDVFDVAENGTKYLDGATRSPVDEAIKLASSSLSKKVTIIAHSNGGLLAKAVMYELEKRGKENIVDKIVFIGTPQLGTPKAIGTILHGYDQQALGGLIIDDGIAREVIKNLPGAYSLLPSEKYFEGSSEPVIYFDNSSVTADLRTGYGSSVNTIGTLNAFMTGLNDNTGRSSVTQSEVNKPTLANSALYFEALEKHKLLLDSWVAPNEVKVFQIAGTGLPTMKAVEYREVIERMCPINAVSVLLCPKIAILKPHIRFTPYGDETVVSDSAIYSPDNTVQKYFFDLDKVENERIPIIGTKISHENLTETSQIKDFVEQVITNGSISDVEFMAPDQSNFSQIFDIEEMNSPVQISSKDEQGRVTGMVKEGNEWVRKEDIPGSLYIEFGGTKYLIIPADVKRTTTLVGEAYGGYTLTLSTLDGNGVQTKRHEVVDATTTPNMMATYSKGSSTYSTIKTDFTGDGIQDYENTVDGVYIAPPVPVYSYTLLKNNISTLPLNKTLRNVLLSLAVEAEKFSLKANQKLYDPLEKLTLRALEATIQLYSRQGLMVKVQADGLIIIVKFLVK